MIISVYKRQEKKKTFFETKTVQKDITINHSIESSTIRNHINNLSVKKKNSLEWFMNTKNVYNKLIQLKISTNYLHNI